MRAPTTSSFGLWGASTSLGTERHPLRFATFNINNINKRLDNLLDWLAKAEPDVVSLQELKAEQEAFPVNALRALGYEAVWEGARSWNGLFASVLRCVLLFRDRIARPQSAAMTNALKYANRFPTA
jgi:hypothetical protein